MTAAYNGSKAALAQWSETLRLELEPLDIKVVTVVTGQVGSNLPHPPKLRDDSVYKPVEAALAERAKGHKGVYQRLNVPKIEMSFKSLISITDASWSVFARQIDEPRSLRHCIGQASLRRQPKAMVLERYKFHHHMDRVDIYAKDWICEYILFHR